MRSALAHRTVDDDDYAPTGASEVTLQRRRYTDPLHDGFIWYDTPGAGTQRVTAYNYYYDQQLYAYDLVILVHDSTLTQVSIMRLRRAKLLIGMLIEPLRSPTFGSYRSAI